jgi:oxalate decarboxylase/phosphoglucose isomerase-like protein (cupin superfamily)
MYSCLFFFAALFPFVSPQYVAPPSRTSNSSMNAALKLAATNFDRHVVLSNDSDWHYDVFKHKDFNSIVGAVMNADAASFPALTGLGISIAVLKIGPCGMLQPHEHPRASNVVIGITGNITSYMIGENHVRTVTINIIPFRVTVFPIGSVHVMQNNGMSPIASFSVAWDIQRLGFL